MKGLIIVIDGTDGCGKKTQTDLLFETLKKSGKKVLKQSFPNYESNSSWPVKMYLSGELGKNANDLDAYQASSFFAVDRLCTWQKLKDFYESGGILIFDRYVQANMIHQTGKIKDKTERDKFLDWLDNFEFETLKLPRADVVLFLDMPPEFSMKLAAERSELKNGQKHDIHEEDKDHLINAYHAGKYVAEKFGYKIIPCVENGKIKTIEEIHNEIVDAIN